MKKTVKIYIDENETSVKIRKLKLKEAKKLAVELARKVDELITLFDKRNNKTSDDIEVNEKDIFKEFPQFLGTNIDYLIDVLIEPYTSLTAEQINEVDITDIFLLLKELVEFNGIKIEQVVNFFMGKGIRKKMEEEIMEFQGRIPTTH